MDVCSALACLQYACVPHLSTQTHRECFSKGGTDLGQSGFFFVVVVVLPTSIISSFFLEDCFAKMNEVAIA